MIIMQCVVCVRRLTCTSRHVPILCNINESLASNHKTRFNRTGLPRLHISYYSTPSVWSNALETQAKLFNWLSECKLVEYGQQYFEFLHDVSGLSWWSSILMSTILVRSCVTLPFSIYQVKRQWNNLIIRDNCHPFKGSIVILVQLPIWVCLSMALRNMASMLPYADTSAHLLYLQLSLGGAFWIPNLTVPDTSYVLPILLGIINLAIIEIQSMVRVNRSRSKLQKYATNFFRCLSVAMIPIAANVPSCMALYWTASSFCGLGCNLVMLSPKLRRSVGIPATPNELQQPYKHLIQQIMARFKS